jgi:hypothetical protein
MSDASWHYARDGVQHGPASDAEIHRLLQSGQLRPDDLLWRDGMAQWQPASRVPEFAIAQAAPVPPPLPARVPLSTQPPPLGYARPQHGYGAQPSPDIGQDAGMRMLLPVGRSGWAIASGYLGLLSVFPFVGVVFGVAAIWTGFLAVKDIKRNPTRHGMGRAIFGIVMGCLGLLVHLVLFVSMSQRR